MYKSLIKLVECFLTKLSKRKKRIKHYEMSKMSEKPLKLVSTLSYVPIICRSPLIIIIIISSLVTGQCLHTI